MTFYFRKKCVCVCVCSFERDCLYGALEYLVPDMVVFPYLSSYF